MKRPLALLLCIVGAVLMPTEAAFASHTTPWQNLGTANSVYVCGRAGTVDVADHKAFVSKSSSSTGCNFISATAGTIGAQALGYKDGQFCAQTSFPVNNSTVTSYGVGNNQLCSNPAGLQNFFTCSKTKVKNNGVGNSYIYRNGPCSNEQSY